MNQLRTCSLVFVLLALFGLSLTISSAFRFGINKSPNQETSSEPDPTLGVDDDDDDDNENSIKNNPISQSNGMKDVGPADPTSDARELVGELAMHALILFSNPEQVKSLNVTALEGPMFNDYIKLAKEKNSELREKGIEEMRQKTLERMQVLFRRKLKKLAIVFVRKWAADQRRHIIPGDPVSIILHQIKVKALEMMLNFLIDEMAKHSGKLVGIIKEFSRGLAKKKFSMSSVFKDSINEFQSMKEDKGQWLVQYSFD